MSDKTESSPNKEGWAERLVAMWCKHKSAKLRTSFNGCRTAYTTGPLADPVKRYSEALERSAAIFDELRKALKDEGEAKRKAASPFRDVL